MSDRGKALGGYTRQLAQNKIPLICRLSMGPDNRTTFRSGGIWFKVEYSFDLLPTHGQAFGARNELIEWSRPASLPKHYNWTVRDYDIELWDQLALWQFENTALRAYIWGRFWLRCRIATLNLSGPFKKDLKFTTTNRQLYIYREDIADVSSGETVSSPWDGSAGQVTLNNPFLTGDDYGHTYGVV